MKWSYSILSLLFCVVTLSLPMDHSDQLTALLWEKAKKTKALQANRGFKDLVRYLHKCNMNVAFFISSLAKAKIDLARAQFSLSSQELEQYNNTLIFLHDKASRTQNFTYHCLLPHPRLQWPANLRVSMGPFAPAVSHETHPCQCCSNPILYLPYNFFSYHPCQQQYILCHEYTHLCKMHSTERHTIATLIQQRESPDAEDIFNSPAMKKLMRAQEYQADWLSLLIEDPHCIITGMHGYLNNDTPKTPTHPSDRNRLLWIRQFKSLIEAEQRILATPPPLM